MADININGFAEELNEKADLTYVNDEISMVDTSAVHKTNSEIISGIKTFSKSLECTNRINLSAMAITKGTAPTATQYWGIRANDKTSPGSSWENTRLGVLEWYLTSDNVTGLTLSAYKNESNATTAATISLQYHGNANKPKIFINGNEMVAFVTESYRSGTEWYRKYSDGWVEQGGIVNSTQYNNTTQNVNFRIAMADTNYYASACPNTTAHQETWSVAARVAVKNTGGMTVHAANNVSAAYTGPCSWEVKGFAA